MNFLDIFLNKLNIFREFIIRNLMSINDDLVIDPPSSTVDKYRATLGHKLNHSFKKDSAEFVNVYHPRYGNLKGLEAIVDIPKGKIIPKF